MTTAVCRGGPLHGREVTLDDSVLYVDVPEQPLPTRLTAGMRPENWTTTRHMYRLHHEYDGNPVWLHVGPK